MVGSELEAFWGDLGAFWGHLGDILGHLGGTWRVLGRSWRPLGTIFEACELGYENLKITKNLIEELKIEDFAINTRNGIFSDKKIMFTGGFRNMSRSEAKAIAENNGGKVLGSVSKKLDYLIVGNSKPTKRKIDQARSLNIKILSEEDWKKILNN